MSYLSKLLLISFILSLYACASGSEDSPSNTVNTVNSGNNTSTSHNFGQNCTTCHQSGGSAESSGVFTAAGSISGGGTVNFYVTNSSQLLKSIETDASGNFYTTESINGLLPPGSPFGTTVSGVNVSIVQPGGGIRNMPGVITEGSCSACHGNGQGTL